MPDSRTLLFELGCEELPARFVGGLAEALATGVAAALREAGLLAPDAPAPQPAWTPRRLIVLQRGMLDRQSDRDEEITGPPVKVAIAADGRYTAQATGFAARQAATAADLYRLKTPKGEYVALRRHTPGRAAAEVLGELLPRTLAGLDLPKSMRWQDSARFLRPVRWLVVWLDAEPVAMEWAGLRSGAASQGHRALSPGSFTVTTASDFPHAWERHHVLPLAVERRRRIEAGAAAALGGGRRVRNDAALLETLVDLVEFPAVLVGEFAAEYLTRLPEEVLVTVMRDHQKYFAVEDADGRLANAFVAVMNLDGDRAGLVRHGHERVLRARFNDACFFWDTDRRLRLDQRLALLEAVTFHGKLGDYRQKAARVERLAVWLAQQWGQDGAAAAQAARLCKCDLTAELVKEFTELQGIMGGRFAEAEGLSQPVADAIYDHYLPLSAQGPSPRSPLGAAVAIADKLDSIAGLFALGEIPTGSADPFALRRQGNGIVRTLLAHDLRLSLAEAWEQALAGLAAVDAKGAETRAALAAFLRERQAFYLRESEGIAPDTVTAVLAAGADDPLDVRARARALDAARRGQAEQFAQVAAALKRMRNIVKKEGGIELWRRHAVDPARFEPAEAALALAVEAVPQPGESGGYEGQLAAIAALWAPLDRFFNDVRVNADDPVLRANRLALLAWAADRLSQIADFSELAGN